MGIKRSATEQVTSADATWTVVQMVTGIADHGDSGGPLLCGGQIAAVVHNHTDGLWPQHTSENYQTVDAPWIASTIAPAFTNLALVNGWTHAPFATRAAQATTVGGVVRLRGAIANGTTGVAFTLPANLRPATAVYAPVDLCNATKGRLYIQPTGVATVQAENGTFTNAQCFTSLEGVHFTPAAAGYTALALQNGWTSAPFSTSAPAALNVAGIVQLKGAIANGTSAAAFTLPVGMRPAVSTYVPIDLCNATKGRLIISPAGGVSVQAETAFTNAQCFTSLDGASFAAAPTGFTALGLQNGWTGAPFGTDAPMAQNVGGFVELRGAMASGASGLAFTLPAGLRPSTNVYVAVDLCNATNGRLFIQPSGQATVQAEGGTFTNAQCFTSLEGVSFSL